MNNPTKCNCLKYPFSPPECFDYCSGMIIRHAQLFHLQAHLKVSEPLASKIFELTSNQKLRMLSDFKPHLTESEFKEIESRMNNLSPGALNWIRKEVFPKKPSPVTAGV